MFKNQTYVGKSHKIKSNIKTHILEDVPSFAEACDLLHSFMLVVLLFKITRRKCYKIKLPVGGPVTKERERESKEIMHMVLEANLLAFPSFKASKIF